MTDIIAVGCATASVALWPVMFALCFAGMYTNAAYAGAASAIFAVLAIFISLQELGRVRDRQVMRYGE